MRTRYDFLTVLQTYYYLAEPNYVKPRKQKQEKSDMWLQMFMMNSSWVFEFSCAVIKFFINYFLVTSVWMLTLLSQHCYLLNAHTYFKFIRTLKNTHIRIYAVWRNRKRNVFEMLSLRYIELLSAHAVDSWKWTHRVEINWRILTVDCRLTQYVLKKRTWFIRGYNFI